jgi:acetyl-CoA acetyltransferase
MDVAIIGIGIHPFGRFPGRSAQEMGAIAVRSALADAGAGWQDMQFAYGGSRNGGGADSMVSLLGMTGLPFTHVYNGCATAGSALRLGAQDIESGQHDLGIVVGFDKHERGAFTETPSDLGLPQWYGDTGFVLSTQFFAMKVHRYLYEHEISLDTLAKAASKAYRNGALNPNAWRRKPFTSEEILGSPTVAHPLTQYMFCAPNEGAVAVVICRADQAHRYSGAPIHLRGVTLRTRKFGSFEVVAPWLPIQREDAPTVEAARDAFDMAGIGPDEVDLAQLQDAEIGHEVIHMAETGLCRHGEQESLVQAGETEIGGRLPINTDGGLLANGEPVGASGLRQVYETVLQLRGRADERQVPGSPKVGFTQVYGAPGVSACTVLTT